MNGLPLVVIELKNPVDENATISMAYNQFISIRSLSCSITMRSWVVSGTEARVGTITSGKEWFLPWKKLDETHTHPAAMPRLEVPLKGMSDKRIRLNLIRHFIVFEHEHHTISKNWLPSIMP